MQESQPKPSRRSFFLGAAATGAAAAAIVALPGAPAPETALLEEPKPVPEKGGGYSLSEHVKRYYKTARI
ncbi:MAG TPA: formate dehydrogenase [Polaromonas sp.]